MGGCCFCFVLFCLFNEKVRKRLLFFLFLFFFFSSIEEARRAADPPLHCTWCFVGVCAMQRAVCGFLCCFTLGFIFKSWLFVMFNSICFFFFYSFAKFTVSLTTTTKKVVIFEQNNEAISLDAEVS